MGDSQRIPILLRDSKGDLIFGTAIIEGDVVRVLGEEVERAVTKMTVEADDVLYRFLCELSEGWKAYLRVSSMSEVVVARGPVNGEEWIIGFPADILASPEPNPEIMAALKEKGYKSVPFVCSRCPKPPVYAYVNYGYPESPNGTVTLFCEEHKPWLIGGGSFMSVEEWRTRASRT